MSGESGKSFDFMTVLGGLVVTGVILVFLFKAINNYGLAEQKGTATVVKKIYEPQRKIYVMNATTKSLSVPQIEPEKFLLRLRVGDKEDDFNAGKEIYDSVNQLNRIQVTYKRLRLTRGVSVTGVRQ